MQARWLLASGALLALARAASAQDAAAITAEPTAHAPEAPQPVTAQERETLNLFHTSNRAEIEAGQLAQRRARSATIRRFGQLVAASQTSSDRELRALAQKHQITLERSSDAQLDELKRTLDPALFDRRFLNLMASNQKESLRSAQAAQMNAQSPAVQAFIHRTLPTLEQQHDATLLQLRNSPF